LKHTEKGKAIYEHTRDIPHLAKVYSACSLENLDRLTSELDNLANFAIEELTRVYMRDIKTH